MKVKVINEFIDKYTKVHHFAGEELEMEEARFDEIQNKGNFLSLVVEPESEVTTAEQEPAAQLKQTRGTRSKTKKVEGE